MDSPFLCGGWSMHQPVDWDYAGFLSDMFAPLAGGNPVVHQQPQQQQTTLVTMTAMAPPAPPTYAAFHGTWASPMHQPVDYEIPALMSATAPSVVQPLQALKSVTQTLQQPQPTALPAPAPLTAASQQQRQQPQQLPVSSLVTPSTAAALQSQKESGSGGGGGSTSGTKRDRGARRSKSTALRPQQQQMLDLQKKLDALLAEHAVVEAENERLKTRLRVLEAVLPVRQQQIRWAQSKAAAERAAERCAPFNSLLVNLLGLAMATSGPSSCDTPPQLEGHAAAAAAAAATVAVAAGGTPQTAGGGATAAAADDSPAAGSDSPTLAPAPAEPAPAPCASSSSGATSNSPTTSGNTNKDPSTARRNHSQHGGGDGGGLVRSASLNVATGARGCACHHYRQGQGRYHHSHSHSRIPQGNMSTPGPNSRIGGCGSCRGGGGCDRECDADSQGDSQERWLDAWRAWVREAALLLQAYDARPNDHYLHRLEEAFMKLKSEVVYLGLRHPELVCNMRSVNLETGAEGEFPPDSYWALVVAAMKLDAQQVANCKSALGLYRERMAVVLAERRSLAAQVSCCLTALQLEEVEGRAAPGSRRREQLTLEAEEATSALDANVTMEGHTTSLARDMLGSNLFSRLQVARACVMSYPYFPDALAIITAAVGDQGTAKPLQQQLQPSSQQQQLQSTRSDDAGQPQL